MGRTEGETEEQALPVFAEKYFSSNPVSLGLEFIGVGGCGNCYPFVYLAKQFNIPWYIFSDGEQKTKKNVLKTCRKLYSNNLLELSDIPNVFIIDSEADFEQMLINDGYHNEIETSLNELFDDSDCVQKYINQKQGTSAGRIKTEKICDKCHQNIYVDDIRDYTTSDGYERALNDIMSDNKTAFAPIIADTIVNSSKGLPPLVMKLFDKIKEDFHICQ